MFSVINDYLTFRQVFELILAGVIAHFEAFFVSSSYLYTVDSTSFFCT